MYYVFIYLNSSLFYSEQANNLMFLFIVYIYLINNKIWKKYKST